MALEWFDRVCAELHDSLESICEKYDQVGQMTVDRGAKHPRIEFFVELEDIDRDYFCSLFFDPYNEEFYIETYDLDLDLISRTMLEDIDDIIDVVHESFHDYMNDDIVFSDEDDEYIDYFEDEDLFDDEEEIYDIEVSWETPEVTAYIDEYEDIEVTYKFGIIDETGDGILQRINRVKAEDNTLIRDEFNFVFSKDEASTIISMIASHMDKLTEFDE